MSKNQSTKLIPLTQGKFALVDADVYEYLMQWKWHYDKGYAAVNVYMGGGRKHPMRKRLSMHGVVNQTPAGFDTEHINRDRLDNRRANLRTVTHRENLYNNPPRPANISGIPGITFHKPNGKWRVKLGSTHIGIYESLDEAIAARMQAELYDDISEFTSTAT